jgi:hypothetical protein
MSSENDYKMVDKYLTYNKMRVIFKDLDEANKFDNKICNECIVYVYEKNNNSEVSEYKKDGNLFIRQFGPPIKFDTLKQTIRTINKEDIDKDVKSKIITISKDVNFDVSEELKSQLIQITNYKYDNYDGTINNPLVLYTRKLKPFFDAYFKEKKFFDDKKPNMNLYDMLYFIISQKTKIGSWFYKYLQIIVPVLENIYLGEKKKYIYKKYQ